MTPYECRTKFRSRIIIQIVFSHVQGHVLKVAYNFDTLLQLRTNLSNHHLKSQESSNANFILFFYIIV